MDETCIIGVDDLWRRYGSRDTTGFNAVRGISLCVRRGELFALLGTNGAGKTSALEVMEGLVPATSGVVKVQGLDPYRQRRALRPRIGIVLQEGGLPVDLTVAETARLWAGTLTSSRPTEEALELVDLRHRADVVVRQLSGGEKRRLDLALAILGRPEILFLDEPTAGLDPESRARTWRLVRHLLDAGTTVVLTTHYLSEAEDLADRVAIMHRGQIVRTGSPAEVTAARPARISFSLPLDFTEPVPPLAGAVGRYETGGSPERGSPERSVVVETRDLQRTLTALLGWGNSRRLLLGNLDARSATLEEAFLDVASDAELADHEGASA